VARAGGAAAELPAAVYPRAMGNLPRFWIFMQIAIVVCVLISAVIAIVKL
jgi:hypothetical protein